MRRRSRLGLRVMTAYHEKEKETRFAEHLVSDDTIAARSRGVLAGRS